MRIIVACEKHETRYLDASTPEAWARSALKLLTERFQAGYWYLDPFALDDRSRQAGQVAFVHGQISGALLAALARVLVAEELKGRIKTAQREEREDQVEHENYLEIKQVVEAQNLSFNIYGRPGGRQWQTPVAWELLAARSEYEYESVALEEVEVGELERVES